MYSENFTVAVTNVEASLLFVFLSNPFLENCFGFFFVFRFDSIFDLRFSRQFFVHTYCQTTWIERNHICIRVLLWESLDRLSRFDCRFIRWARLWCSKEDFILIVTKHAVADKYKEHEYFFVSLRTAFDPLLYLSQCFSEFYLVRFKHVYIVFGLKIIFEQHITELFTFLCGTIYICVRNKNRKFKIRNEQACLDCFGPW